MEKARGSATEVSLPSISALTNLFRLLSPMLPIGSYTWSQGLEAAVEAEWIHDRESAKNWIEAVLLRSIASTEGPILLRLFDHWTEGNEDGFRNWNERLLAMRESAEFMKEDLEQGELLLRLLPIHCPELEPWKLSYSFIGAFVLAACAHEIPRELCLQGFLWSWLESQVMTVTRLLPLGFRDSQTLLRYLLLRLEDAYAASLSCADEDLGQSLHGRAIASCWHEEQYSRIYRS